jgi:hypothetical protein
MSSRFVRPTHTLQIGWGLVRQPDGNPGACAAGRQMIPDARVVYNGTLQKSLRPALIFRPRPPTRRRLSIGRSAKCPCAVQGAGSRVS